MHLMRVRISTSRVARADALSVVRHGQKLIPHACGAMREREGEIVETRGNAKAARTRAIYAPIPVILENRAPRTMRLVDKIKEYGI